jgi:hypothetical protein
MGRVLTPAITEIYLCDPTGVRIEALDYITSYKYALIANNYSPFSIMLPAKFDRKKIRLDNIIEIWRGHEPGTLRLDYCGFLRAWLFGDENGLEYTELHGVSPLHLLTRRIVANYAGSAQASMTDQADDMVKAIVKDQLGSDAVGARDLTSVGGGFTIQADLADGQSITKGFSWKNVLEICQEIADASARAGTEVYFDVVPIVASSVTGAIAFQFRTYTGQRGSDRTQDSESPVFVGTEWGNFQNGSLYYDYTDEKNYVYVMGAGEGNLRETTELSDTAQIGMSIWNRCEGSKDARHLEFGDADGRTGDGNTYLYEHKPLFIFDGEIVETPAFRYGRDWFFGDRITATYAGVTKDAMIKKVVVSKDEGGQEKITAYLEVEE